MAIALISQAAYADEGEFGWLYFLVGNGDAVVTVMRRPQPLDGRMQKLLPRVRANDKTEQRIVGATLQAIAAGFLPIGPALREIAQTCDLVINDGAVANFRPENLIALLGEAIDERLQTVAGDHRLRCLTLTALPISSFV